MATPTPPASAPQPDPGQPRFRWLPAANTRNYHLLLGGVAMLILGPLGGVTSAYMFFTLGFAVGGQVLAGILGSAVTFGYGPRASTAATTSRRWRRRSRRWRACAC